MDYIITTRNSRTMLKEVIDGVKRQSNVHKIILTIDESCTDRTDDLIWYLLKDKQMRVIITHIPMVDAKIYGIHKAETTYIVLLDDDVCLNDNWIEKMWPEINKEVVAVHGRVVFDKYLYKWFERKKNKQETGMWARMQNTVVKRDIFNEIPYLNEAGIDPDIYLALWIKKLGYKSMLIPITIWHAKDCHAADFKEGIRAGARHRKMGLMHGFKDIIHYGFTNILGGFRAAFIMKTLYFIIPPIKKTIGMIIGYYAWKKYTDKYDYSNKR